jgi:hypothetical protein
MSLPDDRSQLSQPSRRRRWFQFSLRGLLIAVAFVAAAAFAWRTYVEPYRRQRETIKVIENLGGTYETAEAEPWLRRLWGDDYRNVTLVNLADCPDPDRYFEPIAALPALETLAVGGLRFDDQHLRRLRAIPSLRELLLDSTSVTAEELAALQRANPRLAIYESERLALGWLGMRCDLNGARDASRPEFVAKLAHQDVDVISHLFFRNAATSDDDLSLLTAVRRVEVLMLSGTQVSDAAFRHIRHLRHLKVLYLDGTQVSDDGLEQLSAFRQLNVLYLDRVRVTDRGLAHLKSLSELRVLGISGTQATSAGIADLERALPTCRVFQ